MKPLQVTVRPNSQASAKVFADERCSIFDEQQGIAATVVPTGLVLNCIWYGDLDDAADLLAQAGAGPLIWSEPQIAYRRETVTNDRGMTRDIVLEPLMLVHVETPEDIAGTAMGELSSRRGQILGMDDTAKGKLIWAEVPLSELSGYPKWLRQHADRGVTASVKFSTYSEAPPRGPWPDEPQSAALRA